MPEYKHIGKDFVPPDIEAKVTGEGKYTEDCHKDSMVFARLYTSPMPHGRVTNIDTSAIQGMKGLVGILTADDVPAPEIPDPPILTNHPVYLGEPILAVAAEDERIAEAALARIRVDIEPLPFVTDPLDSVVEGGPNARQAGNIFVRNGERAGFHTVKWTPEQIAEFRAGKEPSGEFVQEWSYGDLEQGFADAEVILEEPFVTAGYPHMSMEPRTSMAYWDDDTCYVYASSQSQSYWMPGIAKLLGVEPDKVVLVSEYTGGGFGSKFMPYPTAALPGWFSKKVERPVQLHISREQEFYIGSARAGFQGRIRIGFASNGRVTAADVAIVEDIGPMTASGNTSAAGSAISVVYDPEAMRWRGLPVITNTTPRGAQRGPGQNQIAAIMAPLIDKAARLLGIDSLEIRRVNATHSGTTVYAEQKPVTSAYLEEALMKGAAEFDWARRRAIPRVHGNRVRGLGIGQAYHSTGVTGYDGLVRITPDGVIHLHSGVGNLGTYSYASTTRAAAEVLKCDWQDCVIHHGRSDKHLPWNSSQAGSNTTFTQTRTNYVAAVDAVAKMKSVAAASIGGSAADYDIDGKRVFLRANPTRNMTYAAVAQRAIELGGAYSGQTFPDDINGVTRRAVEALSGTGLIGVAKDKLPQNGVIPGLAVAFVEIELNLETGKYDILDYVCVAECGTVVHPQGLAAQMAGGAVWGMGMAGLEKHVYDPQNGLPAQVGFNQCRIPTYLDTPPVIRSGAVNLPDPQNPVGARGIGEPAMGCAAAAVMTAISDALDGHTFNRTPVTLDMIVNYLANRNQSFKPLQTNTF